MLPPAISIQQDMAMFIGQLCTVPTSSRGVHTAHNSGAWAVNSPGKAVPVYVVFATVKASSPASSGTPMTAGDELLACGWLPKTLLELQWLQITPRLQGKASRMLPGGFEVDNSGFWSQMDVRARVDCKGDG
ncbi:hypothetical protein E3N88_35079 [Mikania micrantha]|uniref:Uncharacterized protein n=1 Tax=Mikania micrantha TaxID=192012 RepID=A0A5N6LZY4_9ASTR|nr:hypothetical protein E3N88_35079 [Mikania micrantha]